MKRFLPLVLLLSACGAKLQTKLGPYAATLSASPTTYDCTYYGQYNSLSDCQTAKLANCTSQFVIFPNGGIAACFTPVAGWEICSSITTDWIYTPPAYQCDATGGNYHLAKSVIGCSSAICACMSPPSIYSSCAGAGCPAPLPGPIPTCTP